MSEFCGLKRKRLQQLCKKNGIKANGTNKKLIEALQQLHSTEDQQPNTIESSLTGFDYRGRIHELPSNCTLRTVDQCRKINLTHGMKKEKTEKTSHKLIESNCLYLLSKINNLLSKSECDSFVRGLMVLSYPFPEWKDIKINPDSDDEVEVPSRKKKKHNEFYENLQIQQLTLNEKFQKIQDLHEVFDEELRKGHRLVFIEEELKKLIWHRITSDIDIIKIFEENQITQCPRGFHVLPENKWKLSGINECFRASLYNEDDFFNIHRDAQYSPSAVERSILTGVIYLNDDFEGGETVVYFPKECECGEENCINENQTNLPKPNDKSIYEEHETLLSKTKEIQIKPEKGTCLLMSQALIHKGNKVSKGKKWIIKFDIMASSLPSDNEDDVVMKSSSQNNDDDDDDDDNLAFKEFCIYCGLSRFRQISSNDNDVCSCFGFSISSDESTWYNKALMYFREAQNLEKKQKHKESSQLYEKCLSLRYSFPQCLKTIKNNNSKKTDDQEIKKLINLESLFTKLPWFVWDTIFNYAGAKAARNFALAFPIPIGIYRADWEQRKLNHRNNIQFDESKKFIPKLLYNFGYLATFEFPSIQFFEENFDSCCRVAALYAFSLLGQVYYPKKFESLHHDDYRASCVNHFMENVSYDPYYTVRYDPETNSVCCIELNQLLTDIFYEKPSIGSIFNVYQSNKKEKRPKEDFRKSVSR